MAANAFLCSSFQHLHKNAFKPTTRCHNGLQTTRVAHTMRALKNGARVVCAMTTDPKGSAVAGEVLALDA
eukprot:11202447-Lingulodinium_polyedra.AAC.1